MSSINFAWRFKGWAVLCPNVSSEHLQTKSWPVCAVWSGPSLFSYRSNKFEGAMEIPCLTCHPNHTSPTHTLPSAGFSLTHNLAASNPCSGPLKIKGKVPECGTQNFRSKIHCKATVIIKNKFKLILTLSIRTFANVFSQYVSRFFFVFFCQRE